MSPTTRLSLVVPCYNEVEVVNRFHEALSRELSASGRPYEIVYVDDGRSDGTLFEFGKRGQFLTRRFGLDVEWRAGVNPLAQHLQFGI